jgi:hypothetical protein
MTPGSAAAPEDLTADLGVLFVHGIGEQREGQTLVEFADTIAGWFTRWLSHNMESEPSIGRPDESTHIAVRQTELQPDGRAPATARMVVSAPPDEGLGRKSEWLLAESWWAEVFSAPKTTTVLLWILLILPYMLLDQFSAPLRSSYRLARDHRLGWVRVPVFAVLFIASLPLAALFAALVGLLLIPLLLPIPSLRQLAKSTAVRLAATLGDSYILTRSAVQYDAMVRTVADDLAWVSAKSERVAVVAHSQGAALAYDAIRGYGGGPNLELFVTVGQGLAKLKRLRTLQSSGRWYVFAVAWLGVLGLSMWVTGIVLSHYGHLQFARTIAIVGAAVAVAVVLGLRRTPAEIDPLSAAGGGPLRWLDYYASADPVPNGRLFQEPPAGVEEIEVWNRASVITDHTTYVKSRDDFVSCLIHHLAAMLPGFGLPQASLDVLRHARWRGWWRIWWLAIARLVAGAAAIAIVVQLALNHKLYRLGDAVLRHEPLKSAAEAIGNAIRHLVIIGHPSNALVSGVLALVIVMAAAYGVIVGVWRAWESRDIARFFRRKCAHNDPTPLGSTDLGWLFGALGLAVAATVLTAWNGDYSRVGRLVAEHWHWTAGVIVVLAVLPPLLKIVLRDRLYRWEVALMARYPRDAIAPATAAEPEADAFEGSPIPAH